MKHHAYIRFAFLGMMLFLTLLLGFTAHASSSEISLAPLDGDAAKLINLAITTACDKNAGTLKLATGIYHLKSPLIISCPITIIGQGWREAPKDSKKQGTWFSIEQKKEPGIIFNHGSKGAAISNIAFTQPNQIIPLKNNFWQPLDMPAVIMIKDVEGLTFIHNIYMDGVNRGIESWNGGRTTIDGLYGQFFSAAIRLEGEMDISRITDVHSWPYLSDNPIVIDYQQKHLDTIILGRVDGAFIDNVFAYAARTGILFEKTPSGDTGTGVQIGKLECDSIQHCVQVESIGATMMISEMRQFGQKGINSGTPLNNSDAILISGQASILVGQIEARMIDKYFLNIDNNLQCSNIRISNAFIDFSKSKSNNNALSSLGYCGIHKEKNEVLFGTRPAVILNKN